MQCTVTWTGSTSALSPLGFIAQTGSGHTLAMDGAIDEQNAALSGRNLAPRPMEMLLAGAGGCTAYDIVLILKRGRQQIKDCSVQLQAQRADTDPKVFTKIHLHFILSGVDLSVTAVERAIALSHEKYCSATIMLAKTAEITTSYEIKPAQEDL